MATFPEAIYRSDEISSQFSDEFMELENYITEDNADTEKQTQLNVSHMWILAVKL